MKHLNFAFGLAALAGFIASLAAHLAGLAGMDVAGHYPYVWVLHGGIFVVMIPFAIQNRKASNARPTWAELHAAYPGWIVYLGAGVMAYAVLNFLLFLIATEGGNPVIRDGKYLLLSHGSLIRELTLAEYDALRANEVRGFSGHWMVFYFTTLSYYLFKKPAPAAEDRWRTVRGS